MKRITYSQPAFVRTKEELLIKPLVWKGEPPITGCVVTLSGYGPNMNGCWLFEGMKGNKMFLTRVLACPA
jgi:hypothetical protein